ncbi:hypothetical protein TD95_003640 [Thielaviopsis punctulata]|uniref:FAD dependent oxidoreductase domain-containing protein n=1 Tax=Thielaviopsis punctulata TaxID=72032 RepID=A0A0F4Z8H4_9PEZI|nr:hypothetical protein TD95_003640 [Thielaviopsis punctulata]
MAFHFPFPVRTAEAGPSWNSQIRDRAASPVKLPVADPLPSYWVRGPCAKYSDGKLPALADVVIIGSGISGAMTAWNILQTAAFRGKSILMLEARDVCSGATGRNGGHTKGAVYFGYSGGGDKGEAIKTIRLQEENIAALHRLAAELNIDCGQEKCDTLDIFYNSNTWENSKESIRKLEKDNTAPSATAHAFHEVADFPAERQCFVSTADRQVKGIVEYKAGRMSGYKLVRGVLDKCVAQGLQIVTRCPVTELEQSSCGGWMVTTPRGSVSASTVVLATNAYTANVHPAFHKVVIPVRGDVVAIRAGSRVEQAITNRSMSFVYSENDFEYMVVQPASEANVSQGAQPRQTFVLGGGLSHGPAGVLPSFGTVDDGTVNPKTQEYLSNLLPKVFGEETWGKDALDGRVDVAWSGIMGYTMDEAPMVGEVPGHKGLWATVAFQGHGMALALKCAEALVKMIAGKEAELQWFPKAFRLTQKRLETQEFWDKFAEEDA